MHAYMFHDGMSLNVIKATANIETVMAYGKTIWFFLLKDNADVPVARLLRPPAVAPPRPGSKLVGAAWSLCPPQKNSNHKDGSAAVTKRAREVSAGY